MCKDTAVAPDHIHSVMWLKDHEFMVGEKVHEFCVSADLAQMLLDDGAAIVGSGEISEQQQLIQREHRDNPEANKIEAPIVLPEGWAKRNSIRTVDVQDYLLHENDPVIEQPLIERASVVEMPITTAQRGRPRKERG